MRSGERPAKMVILLPPTHRPIRITLWACSGAKSERDWPTRYLVVEQGERPPSHDRLKGHISYGGVVVDGEFISFAELCAILDTYEGFQFSLQLWTPTMIGESIL